MNVPCMIFNQRNFENTDMIFQVSNGLITGWLRNDQQICRLEDITGVYIRLMDDRFLPEVKTEPHNSPKRAYCRSLHDTLTQWCQIAPTRVVNRPLAMGSNSSKPYQTQIISRYGFKIPKTLITNDPLVATKFAQQHEKIIYKSISGVRSIVQILNENDLGRLERIRWCPVQFQEFVEGTNIRVHVIGESAFATMLTTDATDYRYAHRQGYSEVGMTDIKLDDEIVQRCVRLASGLGLEFAGIDLKMTPNNEVYCFEVNPSPAFNFYESGTGQPIAQTVAQYLLGQNV